MLPGRRAVPGPILDMIMPATSDRGLETAPTGSATSPPFCGRAVLGPILPVGGPSSARFRTIATRRSLLFENHKIARTTFLVPDHCPKVSTRAWLLFLERSRAQRPRSPTTPARPPGRGAIAGLTLANPW